MGMVVAGVMGVGVGRDEDFELMKELGVVMVMGDWICYILL